MMMLEMRIITKGIPILRPISIILLICRSQGMLTMNMPTCVRERLEECYISEEH